MDMDSEQGKVFLGGISSETTEERLKEYFKTFGDVLEVVIVKDRLTGRPRGFGFLVFADPAVADRLFLDSKHNIDGRMVEVRKAISRDAQHSIRSSTVSYGVQSQSRTKKIFIGGLAPTVAENDMKKYFQQFGTITDAVVMYDPRTQTPRGFGFVTFDSEDAVDIVVQTPFYELNGKMVEVKRSVPKELSSGHIRFPVGRGGNFDASNGHVVNSTPIPVAGYAPPMSNSYSAAVGGTGTYSSYGPTGYNASIYGTSAGYGPAITGRGYGNTTFVNNISSHGPCYGTSTGSSYGGAPVAYGASNAGNVGLYGNDATDTAGSSMWGAPAMAYGNTGSSAGSSMWVAPAMAYGNTGSSAGSSMWGAPAMAYGNTGGSVEYGDPGSRGISHHGAAQTDNGQSNGNNVGYAARTC